MGMGSTGMGYEVLARKWRPQQFDDVVGQEHVTRTLRNAIEANRIAHAYLFVGPRGIGKTSLARIFAKALNCQTGMTPTPCDQCDSCREITAGTGLDVLEIDGASNNGVDQVRDLRETVKYAPAHSRFKIYIIDEVHMLSAAAFNALLKTLEEPPPHVKFLFATTEVDKILATIISRCQRFDLRRIPLAGIMDRLRHIASAEKVVVDEDALSAIARGSEGGLRDAESALDQLIAFKGERIGEADVLSVFGLVSRDLLERLVEGVLRGDIPTLMRLVAELDAAGKDFQRLLVDVLYLFRDLLVCLNLGAESGAVEFVAGRPERLRELAALTDTPRVVRAVSVMMEAEDRMRHALSRRALLELSLIRAARAASVVTLESILAQVVALKQAWAVGGGETTADEPLSSQPPKAPSVVPAPITMRQEPTPTAKMELPASVGGGDASVLMDQWEQVADRAGRLSLRIKAALKDARPVSWDGHRAVIGLDEEFREALSVLEQPRNRKGMAQAIQSVLGVPCEVEFRLMPWGTVPPVKPLPPEKPADPAPVVTPEGRAGGLKGRTPGDVAQDPAVRAITEMFGGSVMEVRE